MKNKNEGCVCQHCGHIYQVDFIVLDVLWEKISDGRNFLCPACIAVAIEDLNEFAAYALNEL